VSPVEHVRVDPRTLPVRFSKLKKLAQSPLHYLQSCQDDSASTTATRIGSGTHALVFGQPHAVYPDRRAGKVWDAFEAANADRPIMNAREHDTAQAILRALASNPLASSLLFAPGAIVEERITWERDGRACAGTPDVYSDGALVDLKTTKCAEPERFVRDATWRGYHAQLAWYAQGLAANNRPVSDLYIVAVESLAPHPVTVLHLDASAWLAGDALVASWWERLRVCEASNHWPGYTDAMVRFGVEDAGERLIIGGDEFEF